MRSLLDVFPFVLVREWNHSKWSLLTIEEWKQAEDACKNGSAFAESQYCVSEDYGLLILQYKNEGL